MTDNTEALAKLDALPDRKGGARKLTSENVAAIRDIYAEGRKTQSAIAQAFGVTQMTIHNIVNGKSRLKR